MTHRKGLRFGERFLLALIALFFLPYLIAAIFVVFLEYPVGTTVVLLFVLAAVVFYEPVRNLMQDKRKKK